MIGSDASSASAAKPLSPAAARTSVRWRDGDTMLSFGVFAAVVLSLMAMRVADPANWLIVDAGVQPEPACVYVVQR